MNATPTVSCNHRRTQWRCCSSVSAESRPFRGFAGRRRARVGTIENYRVSLRTDSVLAIYPGSFDPLTNGHLDLIHRGRRLVGKLIVSVLNNEAKHPLFNVEERMAMLREAVGGMDNIEIDSFDGLLVEYAARRGASVILRGIRAISDYEYELQMALMNRRLRPDIETMFLLAGEGNSFLSSRMVKEVARLGGNVSGLVPAAVERRLAARFSESKV